MGPAVAERGQQVLTEGLCRKRLNLPVAEGLGPSGQVLIHRAIVRRQGLQEVNRLDEVVCDLRSC